MFKQTIKVMCDDPNCTNEFETPLPYIAAALNLCPECRRKWDKKMKEQRIADQKKNKK